MKTMKTLDGNRIIRVSNEKAAELYHNMEAKYVSKSLWKEQVRDIKTEEIDTEKSTSTKSNKLSKSQKRHLRKASKRS